MVGQQTLIVRDLGLRPYSVVYHAMHRFTDRRAVDTIDEMWLVQHPSVFTQGQTIKADHLLIHSTIPVIQSDRGGQITYHAPGQQIIYTLLDLKRRKLGVRNLVTLLEESVITTLAQFGIIGTVRRDAPGVYVGQKKICSLGLRVRRGCSLHGLALNVAMDMLPFSYINPCGYPGLEMTQLHDLDATITPQEVSAALVANLIYLLGYSSAESHTWSADDYE